MSGYLHGLTATGCAPIDNLLAAIRDAGDDFHHTEDWWQKFGADDASCIDRINAAAKAAADAFRAPPLAAPAPSAMATGEDVAGQWARMNEALGVRAVSDAELDAVFPPGELDSVYLLLNAHGHPIKAFDTYVECQRALADARRLMGCGYSTTSVRRATPPAAPAAVTEDVRSVVYSAFYSAYKPPFGVGELNAALDAVLAALAAAASAERGA